MAGCCEYGNEPSTSIKDEKLLDWPNYRPLKKDSVPWSYLLILRSVEWSNNFWMTISKGRSSVIWGTIPGLRKTTTALSQISRLRYKSRTLVMLTTLTSGDDVHRNCGQVEWTVRNTQECWEYMQDWSEIVHVIFLTEHHAMKAYWGVAV